jgi:iron(III) transport system permease protein
VTRRVGGRTRAPLSLRVLALALAALFAFPGSYLIWRNFTEGADPAGLLFSSRTLDPLGRTLKLAILVSITTAVFGTALAWLTTRTDLPAKKAWRVALPIPLVFPTFIGAAAFIRTLNPGGLANDFLDNVGFSGTFEMRGLFGAWLVLSLFTYPYVYLLVAARLRRLPGALEESARVLGDGPLGVFARVVLPQIAPAIAAGTLLVFLYTISDFGAVQLMRYDTLTRAIHTTQLSNPPVALALSLILLVLAGIVVLAERVVSGRLPAFDRTRTSRTVQYRMGRWRIPALGFVVLTAFLAIGAPMIAIIDWAVDGLFRESRGGRPLTIDQADVLEATRNTVMVSAITAFVAVLAVIPIAFVVGRYRSKAGTLSHAIVIATFALPGILIALSMRFWTLRSDWAYDNFSDTMLLLVFAYVVRFGALAIGAVLIAVEAVPLQLHDAAKTLGAGKLRRLRTIDLPNMAPGILAGAGLVLLSTMKELPISLLISPLGFSTLATRIFTSFEDAFVAEAGIMALVLVSLSCLLTWVLVIRRADHL